MHFAALQQNNYMEDRYKMCLQNYTWVWVYNGCGCFITAHPLFLKTLLAFFQSQLGPIEVAAQY